METSQKGSKHKNEMENIFVVQAMATVIRTPDPLPEKVISSLFFHAALTQDGEEQVEDLMSSPHNSAALYDLLNTSGR